MEDSNLIERISKFHKSYEKKYLIKVIKNKDHFLTKPIEGLLYVLSYSFYQGRRDELSKKFMERAIKVVEDFLSKNSIIYENHERVIEKNELILKYKELYELLKSGSVNKKGDRLMVISLVNLTSSNEEKNILRYLIDLIMSGKIESAYNTLDSIWSIGRKIASLILRDIVYIYELESSLCKEDYQFLQPIDTWVHKLSQRLGLVASDKIYNNEGKDISEKCLELGINPIHYNQGAWYIGSQSLKIVLKSIDLMTPKELEEFEEALEFTSPTQRIGKCEMSP